MQRLLFVALVGERAEVSTGFAISLLKLQLEFGRREHELHVHFVQDLDEALNVHASDPQNAAAPLVAIDTRVSFPVDFVTHVLNDGAPDFVVGVHPMPMMDWDRLERCLAKPGRERLETCANVYNVVPTPGAVPGRYLEVSAARLSAVALQPKAIDVLKSKADPLESGGCVYGRDAVDNGVKVTKDEWYIRSWGGIVHADVEAACGFTGIAEFAGCVGQRHTLR